MGTDKYSQKKKLAKAAEAGPGKTISQKRANSSSKTKDFFGNKNTKGFTFNAAPVDPNASKKHSKEGQEVPTIGKKRPVQSKSNFLRRMYDDDATGIEAGFDLGADLAQHGVETSKSKKKRD